MVSLKARDGGREGDLSTTLGRYEGTLSAVADIMPVRKTGAADASDSGDDDDHHHHHHHHSRNVSRARRETRGRLVISDDDDE